MMKTNRRTFNNFLISAPAALVLPEINTGNIKTIYIKNPLFLINGKVNCIMTMKNQSMTLELYPGNKERDDSFSTFIKIHTQKYKKHLVHILKYHNYKAVFVDLFNNEWIEG